MTAHGTLARTPDEIVAQIEVIKADDFFGFGQEVLIGFLPFSHAKQFLKEGVTEDQWKREKEPVGSGVDYLKFAIGKALDHRGLSAGRSVDKLRQYAWLAGRDDVVKAMDDAGYENYGVPKLLAWGSGFDVPTEWVMPENDSERKMLLNMGLGRKCEPDCRMGCGS